MKKTSEVILDTPHRLMWYEIAYFMILVFGVLYLLGAPFDFTTMMSVANHLTIFLHLAIFFFAMMSNFQKRQDTLSIMLIFLVLFFLLINAFVNSAYSSDIPITIFGYMSMFMIVFYSSFIPAVKKTVDFIAIITVTLSLFFIYLYFSPYAYRRPELSDDFQFYESAKFFSLSLGYSNSNLTAIYLMSVVFILLVLFSIYKQVSIKMLFLSLAVFLIYMLYLTEARSALLAVITFLIIFFSGIKINISSLVISIFLASIFLFAIFYVLAYQNQVLADQLWLNKPMYSGRELLFLKVLNESIETPILGNIAKHRFSNAHNGMLAIYASAGIVNVILYICFFAHNISKRFHRNNKYSYYALLGVLCLYLNCYAEAALMVSGSIFSVLISMLYILANVRVSKSIEVRDNTCVE